MKTSKWKAEEVAAGLGGPFLFNVPTWLRPKNWRGFNLESIQWPLTCDSLARNALYVNVASNKKKKKSVTDALCDLKHSKKRPAFPLCSDIDKHQWIYSKSLTAFKKGKKSNNATHVVQALPKVCCTPGIPLAGLLTRHFVCRGQSRARGGEKGEDHPPFGAHAETSSSSSSSFQSVLSFPGSE